MVNLIAFILLTVVALFLLVAYVKTYTTAVRYYTALNKIRKLREMKEIRGGFFNVGMSAHMVGEEGWVKIPGQVKVGLEYAARIADEALMNESRKP